MEPARKFKIIVNSKECGTCSGATPSAVAKKVVKKLCGTSSKVVRFSLKECKRGCERVCGPYQGRMEKLDQPYKRAGKTITHRVVCGKVRKMMGGRELKIEDFEKREGDHEFRIDTKIGIEPYIFFGSINYLGYNYYNYVIFCEKSFGGQVVIRENSLPLNKLKLKDTDFINLLKQLRNYLQKFNGFRRIKDYLNSIIPDNSPNNKNNNRANVRKPIILENQYKEYPANYQFSGKNSNGKPYNTNNLFRGRGRGNKRINRKLYVYYPDLNYYSLLLTELDYLVNVYDSNSKLTAITYSGVLNSTRINAGIEKIPIKYIDYYLYCSNESSFPKKYTMGPIRRITTILYGKKLEFPCWIIFIVKEKKSLTVKDFVRVSNKNFEIKNIEGISYLFLYSDESSDESEYYKFSISNDCKIFLYSNEQMTEYSIDEDNIELFIDNGLFKLLNKPIISSIMSSLSQYTNIIDCLKKLILMYKKYKRNVNYQSYKRNVNTEL